MTEILDAIEDAALAARIKHTTTRHLIDDHCPTGQLVYGQCSGCGKEQICGMLCCEPECYAIDITEVYCECGRLLPEDGQEWNCWEHDPPIEAMLYRDSVVFSEQAA